MFSKKIRAAWGGEYLGEKLAGDSSMLGLAIGAAVLFERGCSGVIRGRF